MYQRSVEQTKRTVNVNEEVGEQAEEELNKKKKARVFFKRGKVCESCVWCVGDKKQVYQVV
jgi:hypothetical protein